MVSDCGLFCIFLMTNDVIFICAHLHLYMCSFAIHIRSLGKCANCLPIGEGSYRLSSSIAMSYIV